MKRMEYESVAQLRDSAILLNELIESPGYQSEVLQSAKRKMEDLFMEVSSRY